MKVEEMAYKAAHGIASRHALTMGFIATMVLSVGQRILPAFARMRLLWSPKLMFLGLSLLTAGCTLRVSCEILAYETYARCAWSVLPVSGLTERAALTVFTTNLLGTFLLQPCHGFKEPMIMNVSKRFSMEQSRAARAQVTADVSNFGRSTSVVLAGMN